MVMAVQAKAKKRMREEKMLADAIKGFQDWKKAHPRALTQECFDAFDRFVDSVELQEVLRANS